ncbi:MAG: peptidoglycan-binding protein [Actinomycetota bacterium]|nr:peptidoglycan-binding protein [Actinomycetota bacterium]
MTRPGFAPLVQGDTGPAVADVQERLATLGLTWAPDIPGVFGTGTRAALEAFQHRRGLRVDGVCGRQTWSALVEAGRQLGDRLLYRRSPMLRGDDVAELQQRLSALGFDAGRVDGIFGDRTSAALGEFQRNAGLPVDGIAGSSTVEELFRLGSRHTDPELVAAVRDREELRHAPRTLSGLRVSVGEEGGLDVATSALRRALVRRSALVTTHHHPDGSVLAAEANAVGADVFVGVRLDGAVSACGTSYYAGFRYQSPGGRRLAELVAAAVAGALGIADHGATGMSLPVLRETRMPAVICDVGPATVLVPAIVPFADAVVAAMAEWVSTPWD